METWPGESEDGLLSDSHERITTAEEQIAELNTRLVNFHKRTVQMMLRHGASRVVTLPPTRLAGRGSEENTTALRNHSRAPPRGT